MKIGDASEVRQALDGGRAATAGEGPTAKRQEQAGRSKSVKGDITYTGSREADSAGPSEVCRIGPEGDRTVIAWRLDLVNHSPSGLSWGYGGSGPAQCALAILADFLKNNDELAVRLHQDFKQRFVARFGNEWRLTGRTIRKWLGGGGTNEEVKTYEEKARPRTVRSVVADDGGYKAMLDPCGHEVWFAIKPPRETYCGECINELVEVLRKERSRPGSVRG